MAFLVGQRTQEIGVRMALGATPRDITQMVLSRAARWTAAGLAGGLIGSLFATRILRSMLFDVPERDPWTYGMVLPLLLLIALTAAWIPSRRAARVHPMTALRHE
jgi:ABC-type antimicrobial peptide transport system permease subunit